jgi:UPF0755 protein
VRFRTFATLLLLGLGAVETWRILTPTSGLRDAAQIVEVPAHLGLPEIASHLWFDGAIRSPEAFIALSLTHGTYRTLRAGEYEVPRGATTSEVLRLLESGHVRRHTVLHREGDTVVELGRALERERILSSADVVRIASDPTFLRSHAIDGPSAEGYLFPDTYQLVRGMTAEQIVGRMVQRMGQKLTPELRERAREHGLSVHTLLTLASIVEREAVAAEERPLIAAVFENRLRRGMPLQADPTVQYALGKERRALTRADLAADHPYNTYQRAGLPPGPIASPGLGSIQAVLDPAPVKYLYFVKKDDQHHHFSMTIEEHNTAVTRYRLARTR